MDAVENFVASQVEALALAAASAQAILADPAGDGMADFARIIGAGIAHGEPMLDKLGRDTVGFVAAQSREVASALVAMIMFMTSEHDCGEALDHFGL